MLISLFVFLWLDKLAACFRSSHIRLSHPLHNALGVEYVHLDLAQDNFVSRDECFIAQRTFAEILLALLLHRLLLLI